MNVMGRHTVIDAEYGFGGKHADRNRDQQGERKMKRQPAKVLRDASAIITATGRRT